MDFPEMVTHKQLFPVVIRGSLTPHPAFAYNPQGFPMPGKRAAPQAPPSLSHDGQRHPHSSKAF